MTFNDFNYARQATKPEWYGQHEINISCTSGSSPFNEWYGIDGGKGLSARQSALDIVQRTFESQAFLDRFMFIGHEIYDTDELRHHPDRPEGEEWEIPHGVEPADLQDVFNAESKF